MEFHPAVIRGGQIVLDADLPLPDGQRLEVIIRPVADRQAKIKSILRTSGSLADDPDFEAVMEQIERERRGDSPRDLAP